MTSKGCKLRCQKNSPLYVRLSPALSPCGGSLVNLIDICEIKKYIYDVIQRTISGQIRSGSKVFAETQISIPFFIIFEIGSLINILKL